MAATSEVGIVRPLLWLGVAGYLSSGPWDVNGSDVGDFWEVLLMEGNMPSILLFLRLLDIWCPEYLPKYFLGSTPRGGVTNTRLSRWEYECA